MDSGLNNLGNILDAVVSLFISVFGFLPPWALFFAGSVIVFMLGVFVYKLIRG